MSSWCLGRHTANASFELSTFWLNIHLQQKIPLNEALTFHRGLVLLYCMIIMPTVFKLANQTKKIYEIFN